MTKLSIFVNGIVDTKKTQFCHPLQHSILSASCNKKVANLMFEKSHFVESESQAIISLQDFFLS